MAFGGFAHRSLPCIAAPRSWDYPDLRTLTLVYRFLLQTNIRLVLRLCLREILAATKPISQLHTSLTQLRPALGLQPLAGVLCASACNQVRDWPRAETLRVIGRRKRGNGWEGACWLE